MYLYVAVLLVAMATSHVEAQSSRLYDLPNCSIHTIARDTHHADDPNDCRIFYNCDNNDGGVKTTCPSGTLYDSVSGLCTQNATCNSWMDSLCGPSSNSPDTVTVAAQCCQAFYRINCRGDKKWDFAYCEGGTYYSQRERRCISGTPDSDCTVCSDRMPRNRCDATHQEYIDNQCLYQTGPAGSPVRFTMRCAQGTVMDKDQCQCVKGQPSDCAQSRVCTIDGKYLRTDSKEPVFMNGDASMYVQRSATGVTWNPTGIILDSAGYARIPFFAGQDLRSNPTVFRIRFRLNSLSTSQVIMSTGEPGQMGCYGNLQLSVVASSASIDVTVTRFNTPTGTKVDSALRFDVGRVLTNQEMTLNILIENNTLSGNVRIGSSAIEPRNSQPFVQQAGDLLACPLQLGPFLGTVTDLRFWQCLDAGNKLQ